MVGSTEMIVSVLPLDDRTARYANTARPSNVNVASAIDSFTRSPKVEQGSSRIRLINFGERALEFELFTYVLTADFAEFLALREALFLEIASIVEAAGSAFAQPTEFVYVDRSDDAATAPSSVTTGMSPVVVRAILAVTSSIIHGSIWP